MSRFVFVVSHTIIDHDTFEVHQRMCIANTWQQAVEIRNDFVRSNTPRGYILEEMTSSEEDAINEQYSPDCWIRIERLLLHPNV